MADSCCQWSPSFDECCCCNYFLDPFNPICQQSNPSYDPLCNPFYPVFTPGYYGNPNLCCRNTLGTGVWECVNIGSPTRTATRSVTPSISRTTSPTPSTSPSSHGPCPSQTYYAAPSICCPINTFYDPDLNECCSNYDCFAPVPPNSPTPSVSFSSSVTPTRTRTPTISISPTVSPSPSKNCPQLPNCATYYPYECCTLFGTTCNCCSVNNPNDCIVVLQQTPTPTSSSSISSSLSLSKSISKSPSSTRTVSKTPTVTPTISVSRTISQTPTRSSSFIPSSTSSISITASITPSISISPTISITPSVTKTPGLSCPSLPLMKEFEKTIESYTGSAGLQRAKSSHSKISRKDQVFRNELDLVFGRLQELVDYPGIQYSSHEILQILTNSSILSYGNWCGSGHGGFQDCCNGTRCLGCISNGGVLTPSCVSECPPIDLLDAACMNHDSCVFQNPLSGYPPDLDCIGNCTIFSLGAQNYCPCDCYLISQSLALTTSNYCENTYGIYVDPIGYAACAAANYLINVGFGCGYVRCYYNEFEEGGIDQVYQACEEGPCGGQLYHSCAHGRWNP